MQMIEISTLENGGHNNQTYHGILPDGWAIIPDDMEIPDTYPFVNIVAENGVVVSMTAGSLPESIPAEPIEIEPTADEILNAMLGVTA